MKCANCGDPVTEPITLTEDQWVKTKDGYSDLNQRREDLSAYELRQVRREAFCTYGCLVKRVDQTEELFLFPEDESDAK